MAESSVKSYESYYCDCTEGHLVLILMNPTWGYWISQVDNIDSLTSEEKRKAKDAILYLRNLFGKDLSSLISERHPIIHNLCENFAPCDQILFNHDSEIFESLQREGVFQKESGIDEIILNTENKSASHVTDEILCHLRLV